MNAAAQANNLRLRTPEGITFSLPLAGPVARLPAWLIDVAIVFALTTVLGIAAGLLGWLAPDIAVAASTVSFFVVQFGYAILTERSQRGQTVGKRKFSLRVVDLAGRRLQFSQVAIRNLPRAVDFLPGLYLVGGLAVLLARHGQPLGDLAATAVVVRLPRLDRPDIAQLMAGKFNFPRNHVHLCGKLRPELLPEEAALALAALSRPR
jgi:uncharacterized RDD family membrane protein YckC